MVEATASSAENAFYITGIIFMIVILSALVSGFVALLVMRSRLRRKIAAAKLAPLRAKTFVGTFVRALFR